MIDLWQVLLEQIMGGTNLYIPTILITMGIAGLCIANKRWMQMPKYMFATVTSEMFGIYFLTILCISIYGLRIVPKPEAKEFLKSLCGVGCLILVVMMWVGYRSIRIYWMMRRELQSSRLYAQPENYEHNLIEAWNCLEKLAPSKMTKKQKKTYERYKLFLRAQMGSFHANELEIDKWREEGKEITAFQHLLQFFQYQRTGHIELANEHIRQAEALCNADTDVNIRSQILINRGVAYVLTKAYKDAEDSFEKAIHFCEENNMQTPELWIILYYNYIFNKTRLNPNMTIAQWKSELEALQEHLDMDQPQDYIAYQNMELELLRQTGADRKQLEENVHSTLEHIRNSDMPDTNRCRFEASMARIIWCSRLNPTYVLQGLQSDRALIKQLPMPARYQCYKEIQLFFTDLRGTIVEQYRDLHKDAAEYMDQQALKDLEEYRKSLPQEAVYERCFCFQEGAGLQKNHPQTYRWEHVEEDLANACHLYKENGLELEELKCKLGMIDEGCHFLNQNQYGKLTYRNRMQQLMDEVEKGLPMLEEHPVINEIAIRMSFYAYRLDDYERCKKYYEEYCRTRHLVSIEQYAPWMHSYYMSVCFAVRVLYILDTISNMQQTNEFLLAKESVKEIIKRFLIELTEKEYVILGVLLGFINLVALKRFTWNDQSDGSEKAHIWLVFPDFGWEIDAAYNNIARNDENNKIFFALGQHPLENGRSRFANEKKAQGALNYQAVQIGTFGLENFSDREQEEMLEVCDMLEKHLPNVCPTMEELVWAYNDVKAPVGAESEDNGDKVT